MPDARDNTPHQDAPTPAVVWPRDLNDQPDPKATARGEDPKELREGGIA